MGVDPSDDTAQVHILTGVLFSVGVCMCVCVCDLLIFLQTTSNCARPFHGLQYLYNSVNRVNPMGVDPSDDTAQAHDNHFSQPV